MISQTNSDYAFWAGVILLLLAIFSSFKGLWSLTWKSAIGKMLRITVRPFTDVNPRTRQQVTKYAVEFAYEFEVEGKKEKGSSYMGEDKAHVVSSEAEAKKFTVDYAPDSRVVVFYNPLVPSDAILKRTNIISKTSFLFIGLSVAAFSAYSFFWQRENSPEALETYRNTIHYSIEVASKKKERAYQIDQSWRTLSTIPKDLKDFSNLERLNLSNNNISDIPVGFKFPDSLLRLNLSQNKFTRIPISLAKHPKLFQLDLSNNQITTDSGGVFPRSLRILDLSNNNLKTLSEYLVRSSHIDTLYARNNQISSLPGRLYFDSLYDKEPPTLKVLDLRGNPIPPKEHKRIMAEMSWALVLLDSLPPEPVVVQKAQAKSKKPVVKRKRWGL